MSEHFQPGQHPDADQLSAFAEQALPVHERQQTLAHLAHCADCREIVYLAQQAGLEYKSEPQILPQPVPARRPWFSGWTLAWPAVALACVVLATVYLHRLAVQESGSATTAMALNAPRPSVPKAESQPSTKLHPARPLAAAPSVAPPSAVTGNATNATSSLQKKEIEELSISGRDVATLQQPLAAPARGASNGATGEVNGQVIDQVTAGAAASGNGMALGAGLAGGPDMVARSTHEAARQNPPADGAVLKLDATRDASVAAENELKTAPPAAAPARVRATVGPMAMPAMDSGAKATDSLAEEAAAPQKPLSLPSHLAAVSSISNARLMLAIDSAGTLFFSKDAGNHWKSITPLWIGRAIKVGYSPAMQRSIQGAPRMTEPRAAKVPATVSAMQAQLSPVNPTGSATLTGVVTDSSGAVIPGATVTAIESVTSQARTAKTDGAGRYAFEKLTPGKYALEVREPGFATKRLNRITVTAAQQAPVNVALNVSSASATVTVESDASTIKTESPDFEVMIEDKKSADALPTAFELTTDTGAVWTSSDGRHWKRK